MRLYTPKNKISVTELTVYSMLGGVMYLSKFLMQLFPNIHLLALFITVITLTYRAKALIPLYVYILLDGLMSSFSIWWIPYIYIWLPLWGAVMVVSKIKMSRSAMIPVYMVICGLHGLGFGILYAPMQAIMFNLSYKAMLTWIITGLPFDLIHGVNNFFVASLVFPLHTLIKSMEDNSKTRI